VIIEEGLFNNSFVMGSTEGFEEYENTVSRKSLDEISHETGVPVDVIEEIARDFAYRGDAAVAVGNSGSIADQVAINNLNILSGSISKLWWNKDDDAIPYSEPPEIELDSVASNGVAKAALTRDFNLKKASFGTVPDNLANGTPYPIKALFIYYANPVLSVPNTQKVKAGLDKVPFIVNFSPFLDETAQMSDLILPDNSPLEKLQDVPQFLLDGTPVLGLRQPVVEKRHDTMQTGDVIIQIASRLGGSVSAAIPWSSFQHFLIFDAWTQALSNSAWWNLGGRLKGVGRVNFNAGKVQRVRSHADHVEGEFQLNVYKLMTLTKPRNTSQPTLFDIAGPHIYRKWVAWVEINPETAHELHIEDEDWVWVESSLGRERFMAKLYEGTMPGVVNIPLNIGAKGYAPWEKKMWPEQNPMSIVDSTIDAENGHNLYDTKVRISKV
jgi:anaerobic selenocysteine-containing dehydrogenase